MKTSNKYKAIIIGVSSGGMEALKTIFPALPEGFSIPIIIVQHLGPRSDGQWISILGKTCRLRVKEADEKEEIKRGYIYIAPPNYHLLIEKDRTFSLTIDEKVNYARPSIDVLFETAAGVYKNELVGVVLTGANHDGAEGLKQIKKCGGLGVVQDPADAASPLMPASAIAAVTPDFVLSLEAIIDLLIKLDKKN